VRPREGGECRVCHGEGWVTNSSERLALLDRVRRITGDASPNDVNYLFLMRLAREIQADERAAIVAWLRGQRTCGGRQMPNARFFADAIERGEHLR